MTHGYTTTYTNDPSSPVKAAQTEIAPVLLCVSQQCYSTVFISDAFNERCTDTVYNIQRDELKSRSLPLCSGFSQLESGGLFVYKDKNGL